MSEGCIHFFGPLCISVLRALATDMQSLIGHGR